MAEAQTRTAMITGASSGIGRAFAEAYARRGTDIVAVARRDGPLQTLADDMSGRFGVNVTCISSDLSDPKAPEKLFEETNRRDLNIDILVNNAGFGVPGYLCDVEWERHRSCIEVMATVPVHLSHLYAPGMTARGFGRIVNVSSLSALLPPHAGGTLYYPVKSFLYQFSLAFGEEMRGKGVNVVALCPGFTETNFQTAAGGTVESVAVPRWLWTQPNEVAEAAVKAAEAGRPVSIPGLFNKTVATVFRLLPPPLARRIVR